MPKEKAGSERGKTSREAEPSEKASLWLAIFRGNARRLALAKPKASD
ncbi:hypothetical protein J6S46_03135 [Candidatus Saccharibacteria bacterium]|nr:hypothetical protein [Candidatus Saccharibacteria bacterium]